MFHTNLCFVFWLFMVFGFQTLTYADYTEIRITGGYTPNVGLIEINGPKGWGTICSDDGSWNTESARVACKQLGFRDVIMAQEAWVGQYGYTMGPSYITDIECNGNEDGLKECRYQPYRGKACSYEAAAVCEIPGYRGCYHADVLLSNEQIIVDLMNLDVCLEHCASKHYQLASLQHTTCHCSNGGGGIREAMSSSCNLPCPGAFHHLCGGTQFYSVYDTTIGYCPDPGTPRYGFKEVSSYRFGGIATFACRHDLWLIGPHTIECIVGSSDEVVWSDDIPKCSETPPATTTSVFELPFISTTPMTTMASKGYIAAGQNPDKPSDSHGMSNEKLAWMCLILLPIVAILIILVYLVRRKQKRAKQDKNDNQQRNDIQNVEEMKHPSAITEGVSQHDLTYIPEPYGPSPVSPTSSQAYAEIDVGEQHRPATPDDVQDKNGIQNGVTQHDMTYSDEDQVIPSSMPKRESYAEIDENGAIKAGIVDQAGTTENDSSEMNTSASYAEIEDPECHLDNGAKVSPAKTSSSGNSYAEIKDPDVTDSTDFKMAADMPSDTAKGNSYAEIQGDGLKHQNDVGRNDRISEEYYAEIENSSKVPKESVASYISFGTPQNEPPQNKPTSTASYISFEAPQQKSPSSNSDSSCNDNNVFFDDQSVEVKANLPTITESDETLQRKRWSTTSSMETVENIIYESPETTL